MGSAQGGVRATLRQEPAPERRVVRWMTVATAPALVLASQLTAFPSTAERPRGNVAACAIMHWIGGCTDRQAHPGITRIDRNRSLRQFYGVRDVLKALVHSHIGRLCRSICREACAKSDTDSQRAARRG